MAVKIKNIAVIKEYILENNFYEYDADDIGVFQRAEMLCYFKDGRKRKGNEKPIVGIISKSEIPELVGEVIFFSAPSYYYRALPDAILKMLIDLQVNGYIEYGGEEL